MTDPAPRRSNTALLWWAAGCSALLALLLVVGCGLFGASLLLRDAQKAPVSAVEVTPEPIPDDAPVVPPLGDLPIDDALVGDWTNVGGDTYLWSLRSDGSFDNERGSEGRWWIEGDVVVLLATNQGSNPSTWRLRLYDSGTRLEGPWSDPAGNSGSVKMVRE